MGYPFSADSTEMFRRALKGPVAAPLHDKTSILKCPSCGALLVVSADVEGLACTRCAAEHMVVRQGETAELRRVVEAT